MPRSPGSVRHAAYLTVHEFPARRGHSKVETAALVIGRAVGTTYNKVDPATEQGLTLEEGLQLVLASRDYRILHAFAQACDHVAVPLADLGGASDLELLDLCLHGMKAAGERASAMRTALEDGRIDARELREIRELIHREVRALLELLSRLEAIASA